MITSHNISSSKRLLMLLTTRLLCLISSKSIFHYISNYDFNITSSHNDIKICSVYNHYSVCVEIDLDSI
ncbi:CPXV214 protein [Cowpox virus]|uniref:CPXV214 protein n=2 Tax=Cowpox virus TaxID=10243 RepID=U5TNQ7_COWPX|nr:CPXV214 protein [Cowpox virus]AGY99366.1 CPXV214 protein [Cowpox virus]AGY99787.1 CPXV214 protein [Cowpox virus]AGZ00217.1 CPXV214 protein [Cowpox virus]AGZ00848.1 CPXV214 protein [Cowpox virus]